MSIYRSALSVALFLALIVPTIGAQEIHPKKAVFADVSSWPTTSPGQVGMESFSPFRAVYDRSYRQGSGPNAGDPRHDRVVISAEHGGWDGESVAIITVIDSGIPEHSDTNARATSMFVSREDLSARFEIGPVPGKGKDYYIGRVDPDVVSVSMVTTDTQELAPQRMETSQRAFGPGVWVMASMKLEQGKKINLGPFVSPQGNVLTSTTFGHVVGRRAFVSAGGQTYDAWVIETSRNPSSPKVSHVYVTQQPPYYLGTETVDLDTGERKRFTWLRAAQLFNE